MPRSEWQSLSPDPLPRDSLLTQYRAGHLECVRHDNKPLSRKDYRTNLQQLNRELDSFTHTKSTASSATFKIRQV